MLLFFAAYERDDDDNDISCAINSMSSERIYAFLSDTDGPGGPVLTSSQRFGSQVKGARSQSRSCQVQLSFIVTQE